MVKELLAKTASI